ncbi:type VI secretion system tip protein VgrG [Marivibrio halodurans]|uniref:Type VI secretion system tip protein VgrG n=1 Tax=Marivibrio halodurans TaxID=2039722 RepID=A0A8J7S0R7_9PROT|nr:type VI secretion system tip protein VgrG [Marivibrio halodurans]MBP5857785.1 type VI secretion system tip protein VgrG [Marivibrio halodurans]
MSDDFGYSQDNLYLSVTTPLGKDKLLLKSVRGTEAVSRLFRFEFEMTSEDPAIDFAGIVGESVTARIEIGDGTESRYVNGIVTAFSQHDSDPRFWLYRAVVEPTFWLGTRQADCRIFQDQSVTDIIETVLGELGVSDYSLETAGSYAAREYCVQYNESAFDFLSRLMEEEGIFYFFRHEDGKHTLVLADDADVHADCPGAEQATYRPTIPGRREEEDTIFQLAYVQRVTTDKVAARDYNFEQPSTDLTTQAAGDGTGSDMEVYEYPGGYTAKDAGDKLGDIRLQAFETPVKELSGRSSVKGFVAGYNFSLIWHERESLNDSYMIRELSLRADADRYENGFVAQPATHPFRPARVTRRPRIHGSQTALVTGKAGEEIWTDKYGRIKVQFHWDREGEKDENTTCFVRVAQGWAGKSWGSWFIPRIGMEVVVSFLEGDPDRPLVTGCVYNGENMPAYGLPGDQTKSWIKTNSSKGGGGSNELRFEDKKGSEEVYLHAEKDWNSVVENLRTTTINESDDTLTIKKGNRTFAVEKGDETHSVKGTRTLTVDGAQNHKTGDGFTHKVTGDYTLKVSGDLVINATGNVTIKAGKKMTLQAGTDTLMKAGKNLTAQSGMDWTQKAGKNLAISSGMNTTNKAGMNMTNKAGMNMTNQAGMNMTEKAGMTFKAEGGMTYQTKGGMQMTQEGGMMATIKGGLQGVYEGGLMSTLKGGVMAALKGAINKLG